MRQPISRQRILRQAGVTLIELMVALAIAGFLMVGAIDVFLRGRDAFRLTESISRLQENGRFALAVIEPDIRMANYWGLTSRSIRIQGRKGSDDPLLGTDGRCGADWLVDLDRAIDGVNNAYAWAAEADCAAGPAGASAVAAADTLVVRRVGAEPLAEADLEDDALYLQTSRFQDGRIFVGTDVPSGYTEATSETHQLVVNGYYVSNRSVLGADLPSLRRKTLIAGNIEDEEVLPGIEDMQVQFGIDTDVVGSANRGSIDRYVNPGDPLITLPDTEILAVRVWLRVRAERPETAFRDTTAYVYADRNVAAPNDAFRRIVVTKTIYLRNARPAT